MRKKIGSTEEIIYYGIDTLNEKSNVVLSLKDFVLIYKNVEELRRFIHNENH